MNPNPYETPTPPEPQRQPSESAPGPASSPSPTQRPAPYYTQPPTTQQSAAPSKPRWGLVACGLFTALVLGVGGWYALHTQPAPGPITPAAAESTVHKSLALSSADVDVRATEALKAIWAAGPAAPGTAVLKAANAEALKDLARTSPETAKEVQSGQRALYRLHLLDFLAEDNDEVELFVNGVSFGRVPLTNAGTEILVPLSRGAPAEFKVVATRDGGGGVTFGVVSSLGEARTRVMQLGEFEQWQITMR